MGFFGCLKVSLMLINCIVVILGIGLFGFGIYLQLSKSTIEPYLAVAGVNHTTFAIVLLVDGLLCMAIGVSGCIGAKSEHRGCLVFYSTLLLAIFLVLVIAGGLVYGFKDKLTSTIKKGMVKSLSNYNASGPVTDGWNKVQVALDCCGVTNYTDYDTSMWNTRNGIYPNSCCSNTNETTPCLVANIYGQGCFDGTLVLLEENWYTWGGACIGIAFGLLLSVLLSCLYYRQLNAYQSM